MKQNNKLITFDLSKIYPTHTIKEIDMALFLKENFLFIENLFREKIIQHDFNIYNNTYVNLFCSNDSIVPIWAYLMLSIKLQPIATRVFIHSTKEKIHTELYLLELKKHDWTQYLNKYVIIRGCRTKIPLAIYCMTAEYLCRYATKIMYGEACSNITIFRK